MATAKKPVKKSVFHTLRAISIKGHTKAIETTNKRTGKVTKLHYVPWATAWDLLKNAYPLAQRKVYEQNGLNYFQDGFTGYVKVGIIVEGEEQIDMLPIMSHNNKSIDFESITSFDVNKTIARSTVKAIALHGLGIDLWDKDFDTEGAVDEVESKDKPKRKEKGAKPALVFDSTEWNTVAEYVKTSLHLGDEKIMRNVRSKFSIDDSLEVKIKHIILDEVKANEANSSDATEVSSEIPPEKKESTSKKKIALVVGDDNWENVTKFAKDECDKKPVDIIKALRTKFTLSSGTQLAVKKLMEEELASKTKEEGKDGV